MTDRFARLALALVLVLAWGSMAAPSATATSPVESGEDTLSIERLYWAAFAREGDPGGLEYWSAMRAERVPLAHIAGHFMSSPEFEARYGDPTDEEWIRLAYANVLDRAPDPDGFEFWRRILASGVTRGTVLVGFSDSAEFKTSTGLIGDPWVPPFAELPRGGDTLFPAYRLVAEYGHPGIPAMGVLGEKDASAAAAAVQSRAARFEELGGRPTLPTFEIIATIAQSRAGSDGLYTYRTPPAEIWPWLDAVRSVDGYLLLDLQPGRDAFIAQARHYEQFLVHADVGLAMDPEWSVDAPATPNDGIGSVTAAEINEVAAWLSELVDRHNLAEKLLVIHRFTAGMVEDPENVVEPPGVAIVFHADGFGSRHEKLADYHGLLPDRFERGIKLFLDEDVHMFSPEEVLRLDPPPDMISYQ